MKVCAFTKPWSAASTELARSFYLGAGLCFLAIGLGKRLLEAWPLSRETDDRIAAIELRLTALEKDIHPAVNSRPAITEEGLRAIAQCFDRMPPPPTRRTPHYNGGGY